MKKPATIPLPKAAVLALAEIKATVEKFDRGEANLFDALDAILVAIDGYRWFRTPRRDAA